jgi:hypothetical protein
VRLSVKEVELVTTDRKHAGKSKVGDPDANGVDAVVSSTRSDPISTIRIVFEGEDVKHESVNKATLKVVREDTSIDVSGSIQPKSNTAFDFIAGSPLPPGTYIVVLMQGIESKNSDPLDRNYLFRVIIGD